MQFQRWKWVLLKTTDLKNWYIKIEYMLQFNNYACNSSSNIIKWFSYLYIYLILWKPRLSVKRLLERKSFLTRWKIFFSELILTAKEWKKLITLTVKSRKITPLCYRKSFSSFTNVKQRIENGHSLEKRYNDQMVERDSECIKTESRIKFINQLV